MGEVLKQLIESPKNKIAFGKEFTDKCNTLKSENKIPKIYENCIEYVIKQEGGFTFNKSLYAQKDTEHKTYQWLLNKATEVEINASGEEEAEKTATLSKLLSGTIVNPFIDGALAGSCFDKDKDCIPVNTAAKRFYSENIECATNDTRANDENCFMCKLDIRVPDAVLAYPMSYLGVASEADSVVIAGKCSYTPVLEEVELEGE